LKKITLITTLLIFSNSAFATTLNEILKLSLKNNPTIKKAKQEIKITKAQYEEAISKFLPEVKLEYAKTHLSKVPTFPMNVPVPGLPPLEFSMTEKNFYNLKIEITQPVFMGGKLILNKEIKRKLHTASFYLFQETVNQITNQVKKDFYKAVEAKNALIIAESFLKAAKEHYKTVKSFYDEGIVARRDLLEAEVQLKRAEESLDKARSFYKIALEKIKEDTGYTIQTVSVPQKVKTEKIKLNLKSLIEEAYKNRPILKALKLQKKVAKEGVKLSYAAFSPNVFLNLSYNRNNQYPFNENFKNFAAMIGVSIPVFEGGERFFKIEEARERKEQVNFSYEEAKNKVKLQVTAAYLKLKTAASRIETAKVMVKEAKELLKDSKERYKEQVGTSTEVVDAIAYLTKAENTLNSALADYNKALADLEYAVGKSLR